MDVEAVQAELIGHDAGQVVIHHAAAVVPVSGIQQLLFLAVEDRSRAGDAWTNREDLAAQVFRPFRYDLGIFGTGTDQGHLASQHVPQLGQLVELGEAQPAAEGGDARVILSGDRRTLVGLRAFIHAAELQHAEVPAALACAQAAIKDRTRRFAADEGGEQGEQRCEEEQAQ